MDCPKHLGLCYSFIMKKSDYSNPLIGNDHLLTKGVRIHSWHRFSHSPLR
jgi:hypothetical protein